MSCCMVCMHFKFALVHSSRSNNTHCQEAQDITVTISTVSAGQPYLSSWKFEARYALIAKLASVRCLPELELRSSKLGLGQTVAGFARSSLTCTHIKAPSAFQGYGIIIASVVRACSGCFAHTHTCTMQCMISTKVTALLRTVGPTGGRSVSAFFGVQKLLKVEWGRRIPADAILQTVMVDFCERFCLPTCQMFHKDRLLRPDQKLMQVQAVHCLLLQHCPAQSVLCSAQL